MLEAEGATPSIVRDHAFEPRVKWLHVLAAGRFDRTEDEIKRDITTSSPNPYLCVRCRLAEAAHEETTVGR